MSFEHSSAVQVPEKENLSPTTQNQSNDDIIKNCLGDFGRWQFKVSFLMALVKFPIAWFQMSIVFLAPPMSFWCKKYEKYDNWTETKWIESTMPTNSGYIQNGLNQGYCFMKNIDVLNTTATDEKLISCVNGYTYNKTVFKSSIVSEWDLVCDRQNLVQFSQIIFMFGVLLGNVSSGVMADKHGRKKVLIACLILESVFGIMASISPFLWLFILLRFLLAFASGGTMTTTFVMCMEVVGGKWRTIVPILYQIPFGFGLALMSGLAYLIREWRYFHLALSLLSSLYILLIWLIPESPRWLLAVGRRENAIKVLRNAAKENKRNLSQFDSAMIGLSNDCSSTGRNKAGVRALFSTRKLAKRSCLVCANWAIAGVIFYTISLYMGHIGENLFLTVAVGGFGSLPGALICVVLVSRYGRRLPIMYCLLLAAASFLVTLIFPKGAYAFDWPRILFTTIAHVGLSIAIPALFLFSGELFPTVLRNSGIGFAMMFFRLSSMIAPLIISLQNVATFLPLLIIGIATLIQVILVFPLPETKGIVLPDTIKDLDNVRKSKYLEQELSNNQNGQKLNK